MLLLKIVLTPALIVAASVLGRRFGHALIGPQAAIGALRGLLFGQFAFMGFFVAFATLVVPVGLGPASAAAVALALVIQGTTLVVMKREGSASGPRPVRA